LRGIVVVLASLLIAGCLPTKEIELRSSFDPKEAAYAQTPGTARIVGQAFIRQKGGGVVTAAGEPVLLLPAVPQVEEMVAKTADARGPYAPELDIKNLDPRLKDYTKKTIADATGNFTFDKLSAGDYYIVTRVVWTVPGRYGGRQGGELVQRVTLKPGEEQRVIMSR